LKSKKNFSLFSLVSMSGEAKDELKPVYETYEKLESAADPAQAEALYHQLIGFTKGDLKSKQLTGTLLPKAFTKCPNLTDEALNAQLDLIEDDSNQVRMYAIPGLAVISKTCPRHAKQIADVVIQLLLTEDKNELAVVNRTLAELVKQDAKCKNHRSLAPGLLLTYMTTGSSPVPLAPRKAAHGAAYV